MVISQRSSLGELIKHQLSDFNINNLKSVKRNVLETFTMYLINENMRLKNVKSNSENRMKSMESVSAGRSENSKNNCNTMISDTDKHIKPKSSIVETNTCVSVKSASKILNSTDSNNDTIVDKKLTAMYVTDLEKLITDTVTSVLNSKLSDGISSNKRVVTQEPKTLGGLQANNSDLTVVSNKLDALKSQLHNVESNIPLSIDTLLSSYSQSGNLLSGGKGENSTKTAESIGRLEETTRKMSGTLDSISKKGKEIVLSLKIISRKH